MSARAATSVMRLVALCLLLSSIHNTHAKTGLCEVETGQSSIIVDIEESRGSYTGQSTIPAELPIEGDPLTDIVLDLVFPKGNPLFTLNGKKLQLLQPLDRDADNLSHIVFQLTCVVKAAPKKKRSVPVIVRVTDINDNAPVFVNTPYETTVSELVAIGTTIFQNIKAVDADAGVNGLSEYFIVEGDGKGLGVDSGIGNDRITTADGYGFFAINLPHQGQVTVNRTLDYERTQRYLVTIVASDRARNASERFSSTTTLTVNIKDDDDQDPSFIYQGCMLHDGACINPEYSSSVSSGILAGTLNIYPEKIQAVDMDTINSPIRYSFMEGNPSSYKEYFEINPTTGSVRQIKAADTSVAKKFDLVIRAEEMSESKRYTTAKLTVVIKPVDANPPVIRASSTKGHVDENVPIGTKVVDELGKAVHLTVTDDDLGPNDVKPAYTFELTTNYFQIDKNGILVVNEENLDRDPPSPGTYRFQVVARETNGQGASAPVSFEVTLDDVNDNTPVLVPLPHVKVPAGEGRRHVVKVEATDNDSGDNAVLKYSIYHVSNNGANKFKIDPQSGVIETLGKLDAGEQYSITVQAQDIGGLASQEIVEVSITPGPNTRPPIFDHSNYDVEVSEGASLNSTVTTLSATDPENDPITYSIISGNDLRQFSIGSTSGVITVIRKLDREDLTSYQLLVKAEDTGKLSTTATVNIKVTDINDKNPEFTESDVPYIFKVKEGLANTIIGKVHATDLDEGINAEVTYSIPGNIPFRINNQSGEISTKIALDYEKKNEYSFVVTAKDGAPEPRLGTATVTVQVQDVPDELPFFRKTEHRVSIPENVPDLFVVQVMAEDPDTLKEITYIIKQGNTEMFSIDRKTGVVKTIRGLDYERESMYILIIGTEENDSMMDGSITKVIVDVEDRNDLPPTFTTVPRPITLDDEVSIGTTVTTMIATDSDGTSPNNKVRYQLVGRDMASKYFQIDPDSGVLRIRDDLRKEISSEYQVDIKAYDLGEPQLSSVSTLNVYVRHVATVPPEIGLSFADTSYTEEVPENATAHTLLKTIVIINQRSHSENIPLKCEITKGNEQELFYAVMTDDKNCAIYLIAPRLDYENQTEYILEVHLDSLQGLVNPERSYATLRIHVTDINDNSPFFIFPEQPEIKGARKKYYAVVTKDVDLDSNIVQVQAKDLDSGNFGRIQYKESSWGNAAKEYFTVDSKSGLISNSKTFDNVPEDQLPFILNIAARDNPGSRNDYTTAVAPVIVNLLTKNNQLVLVFKDARPEVVRLQSKNITRVIEEKCDLIVGVEKFSSRQYISENDTLELDPSGTDMWFYVIDPNSGKILERNSSRVQRSILEPSAQSNITFVVSGVARATASAVRAPLPPPAPPKPRLQPVAPDAFPYALIIIACVIFVLGVAGIIYICVSWNRYRNYKSRIQRHYSNAPSRYDPVISGPAPSITDTPSLKEYETQVLNMAVPLDDCDSCNDLQLDFSANNHTFSLDNVSYITKDNGQSSPTSSEAATTARASSVASPTDYLHSNIHTLNRNNANSLYRNNNHHLSTLPRNDHHHHQNSFLDTFGRNNTRNQQNNTYNRNKNNLNMLTKSLGKEKNENKNNNTLKREGAIMAYDEIPGHNSGFQRSSDDDGMVSPSNDNVTFGKRDYAQLGFSYLNDRSPVETTTEL